jgi:DNA-binding response OmpR family regulator
MERLDLAVLDINLGGTMSFPIAEALARRGIPFLFLTGYGDTAMELTVPENRQWPVCSKPFNIEHLVSVLEGIIDTGSIPAQ